MQQQQDVDMDAPPQDDPQQALNHHEAKEDIIHNSDSEDEDQNEFQLPVNMPVALSQNLLGAASSMVATLQNSPLHGGSTSHLNNFNSNNNNNNNNINNANAANRKSARKRSTQEQSSELQDLRKFRVDAGGSSSSLNGSFDMNQHDKMLDDADDEEIIAPQQFQQQRQQLSKVTAGSRKANNRQHAVHNFNSGARRVREIESGSILDKFIVNYVSGNEQFQRMLRQDFADDHWYSLRYSLVWFFLLCIFNK